MDNINQIRDMVLSNALELLKKYESTYNSNDRVMQAVATSRALLLGNCTKVEWEKALIEEQIYVDRAQFSDSLFTAFNILEGVRDAYCALHSTDPLSVEEYAKLFQGRVNTLILDRGIINA